MAYKIQNLQMVEKAQELLYSLTKKAMQKDTECVQMFPLFFH